MKHPWCVPMLTNCVIVIYFRKSGVFWRIFAWTWMHAKHVWRRPSRQRLKLRWVLSCLKSPALVPTCSTLIVMWIKSMVVLTNYTNPDCLYLQPFQCEGEVSIKTFLKTLNLMHMLGLLYFLCHSFYWWQETDDWISALKWGWLFAESWFLFYCHFDVSHKNEFEFCALKTVPR